MCDQKADFLGFEMGTRSVAEPVFFLKDGGVIFNSCEDSLVRKERLLKARLTRVFELLNIFTVLAPASPAPARLNWAFSGREEMRKTALSPDLLRITVSMKATSEINAIRKSMCRNRIKV